MSLRCSPRPEKCRAPTAVNLTPGHLGVLRPVDSMTRSAGTPQARDGRRCRAAPARTAAVLSYGSACARSPGRGGRSGRGRSRSRRWEAASRGKPERGAAAWAPRAGSGSSARSTRGRCSRRTPSSSTRHDACPNQVTCTPSVRGACGVLTTGIGSVGTPGLAVLTEPAQHVALTRRHRRRAARGVVEGARPVGRGALGPLEPRPGRTSAHGGVDALPRSGERPQGTGCSGGDRKSVELRHRSIVTRCGL